MRKKNYCVKLTYINEKLSKIPMQIQGVLDSVQHKNKKSVRLYRRISNETVIQTFNLLNTEKIKNVYFYKQ